MDSLEKRVETLEWKLSLGARSSRNPLTLQQRLNTIEDLITRNETNLKKGGVELSSVDLEWMERHIALPAALEHKKEYVLSVSPDQIQETMELLDFIDNCLKNVKLDGFQGTTNAQGSITNLTETHAQQIQTAEALHEEINNLLTTYAQTMDKKMQETLELDRVIRKLEGGGLPGEV